MAYLKVDKATITIFKNYIDFIYIFSLKLAIESLEHMDINNLIIKLGNDR